MELDSGRVYDELKSAYVDNPETLYILLVHYSKVQPMERVGKPVKFRDLPGGYAYDGAFVQRAIIPIAEMFENDPETLVKAAEVLGGTRLQYGDVSVEVPALPKIPIIYVLWKGGDELQSSASVFFDASASHYLPTEDLAVLGEVTTVRLKRASDTLQKV